MTPGELKGALMQFTGTEQWWRHTPFNLVYTDGVKYFAEKAGAFWFLDIVATEIEPMRLDFGVVKLVSNNSTGSIVLEDGNDHIVWEKKIEFTDAPEGVWRFFLCNNIIMVPSEY